MRPSLVIHRLTAIWRHVRAALVAWLTRPSTAIHLVGFSLYAGGALVAWCGGLHGALVLVVLALVAVGVRVQGAAIERARREER